MKNTGCLAGEQTSPHNRDSCSKGRSVGLSRDLVAETFSQGFLETAALPWHGWAQPGR